MAEEPSYSITTALTVVERQAIHIHSDKPIGSGLVEAAAELHRVFDCLGAMFQTVGDAVVQQSRQGMNRRRAEITTDDVAAQWQRQTGSAIGPPLAEIHDLLEALVGVGQLTLMNQEPGTELASADALLNLIERHDDVLDLRFAEH